MEKNMLGGNYPYAATRALEVGMSCIMTSCGFLLWWHGETFSLPAFAVLKQYINEEYGGLVFMTIGVIRLIALWYNGDRRPTPLFRLAGCAVGVGFWLTMTIAMAKVVIFLDLPGPLLLPISMCLTGGEFYSALRCGADASYLGSLRRAPKQGRGNGGI